MEKKARRISDGKEDKSKANRGASRLQIKRASSGKSLWKEALRELPRE